MSIIISGELLLRTVQLRKSIKDKKFNVNIPRGIPHLHFVYLQKLLHHLNLFRNGQLQVQKIMK